VSAVDDEKRRQRNRFLLLILACVAGIYALWGLSWLVAPDRDANTPEPRPDDAIARLEADLDIAERLLAEDRGEKARAYIKKVEDNLDAIPPRGLRPAQALRLDRLKERLSVLREQLPERPAAKKEGAAHAGAGGA